MTLPTLQEITRLEELLAPREWLDETDIEFMLNFLRAHLPAIKAMVEPEEDGDIATGCADDAAFAAYDADAFRIAALKALTDLADFEIWQDDMMVAGASGPREAALREAMHYAAIYGRDGFVEVFEIIRRPIAITSPKSDPDECMSGGEIGEGDDER